MANSSKVATPNPLTPPEDVGPWIQDSCVVDARGHPLVAYHGSDAEFGHFRDGIHYFTTRPEYGHIQHSRVVYPVHLSIKKPFFVRSQSDIETLRSRPERVDELRRAGFDGAICAQKDNLLKGQSGWGNDYPQLVVFSPDQIRSVFFKEPEEPTVTIKQRLSNYLCTPAGHPRVLYHGTNEVYTGFERTSDIGFHFGTKRAALDRIRSLPLPDVQVELVSASKSELEAALVEDLIYMDTSACAHQHAYKTIYSRVSHPSVDLKEQIGAMTEEEAIKAMSEFLSKPVTEEFLKRAERGRMPDHYVVMVDDSPQGAFGEHDEALELADRIKASFLKSVRLRMSNPLRLEDQGTWAVEGIARAANLSSERVQEIMGHDDNEQRYQCLVTMLKSIGYDGLVYQNTVEDPGSDSYIAFDADQIEELTAYVLPRDESEMTL